MNGSGWPARYEIRVVGALGDRRAAWFGGLQLETGESRTVMCGLLADQAALHGVLAKIRDFGLCLISVRRLHCGEAGNSAAVKPVQIQQPQVREAHQPARPGALIPGWRGQSGSCGRPVRTSRTPRWNSCASASHPKPDA